METCAIDGCDRAAKVRGWCRKHYNHWVRHGDPRWAEDMPTQEEVFWGRVDKRGPTECWLWTGAARGNGYGAFVLRSGKTIVRGPHRVAYTLLVGAVAADMHLDHLCRVRLCCNPSHLEPVTPWENLLRADTPSSINARKTECDHGHPFDEANTYITKSGWRSCRTCHRLRARERKARQRQ